MLFIVAWAAIAFAVIRALVVVWGSDRRVAVATGVAVAGAFALGAISPFALPERRLVATDAPAAAAPPAAPVADTSHPAICPAGAVLGAGTAPGHLDTAAIGPGAPAVLGTVIAAQAGVPLKIGGWIVLNSGPSATICPIVDGHLVAATMQYGLSRPDVATALHNPADAPAGFVVTLSLKPGTHTFAVGAVEAGGHVVDLMQGGPATVQVR